ncbi:MAG: alginate O-acetyltransferase complex protein AlgI [Psychroserpens sp.]|jgi:alginate O-acetyltransferase complex protein AlgI
MFFNSLDFALFLSIAFIIYWFILPSKINIRNWFIVIISYFFYGCWDWRFLLLIFTSSIIDYLLGNQIAKSDNKVKRKRLLLVSLFVNLGFLGFFKYFNFFIDSFVDVFNLMGNDIGYYSISIILPVGISFYTFQTLSYTLDIYKKEIEPCSDIAAFLAFVSFFPQLVAGPIERAKQLLPQFHTTKSFDYSEGVDGLRQILWGLVKKVIIADNCAFFVNQFFGDIDNYSGSTLFLGAIFFSFQIYCDFSGYSDIAIGISKLFGFKLSRNFNFPYFSRDIGEFWRRWHISLTTWFRDYIYIPLGGSALGMNKNIRNIFIVFLVSGLWHGANWTFVFWGFINALLFIPLVIFKLNRKHLTPIAEHTNWPSIKEIMLMLINFSLVTVLWIFFRAESLTQAFDYLDKVFSKSFFEIPEFSQRSDAFTLSILIVVFMLIEWFGRNYEFGMAFIKDKFNYSVQFSFYVIAVLCLYFFGMNSETVEFIYFQF